MSPESRSNISTARTFCFLEEGFDYETIDAINGNASVIKFKLEDMGANPGDILVIMNGEEIHFHGMIGSIDEDNFGYATDARGSLLPATVQ